VSAARLKRTQKICRSASIITGWPVLKFRTRQDCKLIHSLA
jgi:hypothetical protein